MKHKHHKEKTSKDKQDKSSIQTIDKNEPAHVHSEIEERFKKRHGEGKKHHHIF